MKKVLKQGTSQSQSMFIKWTQHWICSFPVPALPGTEWRGAEEVRSGVSGQSQAGGAAIPDAEGPRWGEIRQVRRAGGGREESWPCRQKNYIFPIKCAWFVLTCTSHRANEEIAQVRAKANSDGTALTASLRKEQMKNDSLEQALQQKVPNHTTFIPSIYIFLFFFPTIDARLSHPLLLLLQNREIEELTKICDELIAKMGKIDWVTSSRGLSHRPTLPLTLPLGSGTLCMLQPSSSPPPPRVAGGLLMHKKMQVTSCV